MARKSTSEAACKSRTGVRCGFSSARLPACCVGSEALRRSPGDERNSDGAATAGAIATATAAERENRDTGALQSDGASDRSG